MAKELQHLDAGVELTAAEDNAIDRHYLTGGVTNDVPVYNSVTATLEGKTPAEFLVILSGQAGAAFDWNGQNLTGIGTITFAGMTVSNDGTKTTFLGTTGDYNRIGDAVTTSRGLNSEDDLLVTGELEVGGEVFLNAKLNAYGRLTSNSSFRSLDSIEVLFGNSDDIRMSYEAGDANAKAFYIGLPTVSVDANDVPLAIFGANDIVSNPNLGFFNGITEPTIAVVNPGRDAYVSLDAGDVNGSPVGNGLYFKAAADEDINLLKLSVTGTPTIIYDLSNDAFAVSGANWDIGTQFYSLTEMAAPGAGAANTARIYAFEGGDTLTDLCAVFQDGSIDVFAQETTDPDSPIFQFPHNTKLTLTLRKPDRKTVQFVATFPDGRDFVMKEIRYPDAR